MLTLTLIAASALSAHAQYGTLTGTDWQLRVYDGKPALAESPVTARFQDGRLHGLTGCNEYFAGYTADQSILQLSELGSSQKTGPEPAMAQETAFLKLLGAVTSYRIEGGELYLLDGDGRALLEFVPQRPAGAPAGTLDGRLPTILREGHLWVPLRPLLDWLGGRAQWNAAKHTALSRRGDKRLEVTVGSARAYIGSLAVTLPGMVFEREGRLYVPLALLCDAFDLTAQPHPGTHTMVVTDFAPPGGRTAPMPPEKAANWQALLDKMVDPDDVLRRSAPGVVLLVESPIGRFRGAAGVRDLDTRTPLRATDRLQIGSCTKAFTVILALQLHEQGVWSLDDPVVQWLPDLAVPTPSFHQITLRQLAQNTSGLWDYAETLLGGVMGNPAALAKGYTPGELATYAFTHGKPDFEPGASWGYSSTNFILLGMAVEAAAKQSLANLYRARVFEPAGMYNSFLQEGAADPEQVVHGYYRSESGEFVDSTGWNASQAWAAGAIVSTVEDMGRFVHSLMSGRLFDKPGTLAEMLTFRDIPPERQAGGFARYALGVGSTDFVTTGNIGHTGQTVCFTSLWLHLPDAGTSAMMISNSADCPLLPRTAAWLQKFVTDEAASLHGLRRAVLTTP
jgi:D-alanyl-D-alanine carboxypeptidase